MSNKSKKIDLKVNYNKSCQIIGDNFVVDLRKGIEEIKEPIVKKKIQDFKKLINKKLVISKKVCNKRASLINVIGLATAVKFLKGRLKISREKKVVECIKEKNSISRNGSLGKFKNRVLILWRKFNIRINGLLFVGFIKSVYKFITKSGFLVGWFSLFFIRFFWLLIRLGAKQFVRVGSSFKLSNNSNFFLKLRKKKDEVKAVNEAVKVVKRVKQDKKMLSLANIKSVLNFNVLNWYIKRKVEKEKKRKRENMRMNTLKTFKRILSFSFVLLLLIVPFKLLTFYSGLDIETRKSSIIETSENGIDNFLDAASAAMSMDFKGAGKSFDMASDSFLKAQRELDDVNGFLFTLASVAPNDNMKLASVSRNVLAAGQISADLANNLNLAIENLLDNKKNKNIYHALENFNKYAHKAMLEARILKAHLEKIEPELLPGEYKEKFSLARDKMYLMESSLSEFLNISRGLYEFLGMSEDKRYLLVFQNNSEARATGGFVGSYALVDFRNGKVKNLEVPEGGSYDTEGGLKVLVKAPEPLTLVNPLWHFWDSNWWPDWPTSARKMMWFYENSDGPSVDGVVTFTPTFFEKLLEIIGPVELKEYNLVIDSGNFWSTVQEIVEKQPEKNNPKYLVSDANKPKKIIGDLAKEVLEVMPERLDQNKLIELINSVDLALKDKQVLFYFKDSVLQDKVETYGWDGSVKSTEWDYLSVINSNIAGQKTDRVIDQEINHKAEVMQDGTIINTVSIKRMHSGEKGDLFTGVRNVNWMRVYVPEGSFLIDASGFEEPDKIYFEEPEDSWIDDVDLESERGAMTHKGSNTRVYKEFGKTVFANWTMIDPGESKEVVLRYQLPFKINKLNTKKSYSLNDTFGLLKEKLDIEEVNLIPYALMVQKQAGFKVGKFQSDLVLKNSKEIVWRYPDGTNTNSGGWSITDDLDMDKYWAVLIE